MSAVPTHESIQYVLQGIAHRAVDPNLLDVMLNLFDGHDIPAMRWEEGRRPGYYKVPHLARRTAFEAHLLGTVFAGVYPFRGVTPWCGCSKTNHTCDGRGTRYLVLDLDAKDGEEDTPDRCRAVMSEAWRRGLHPVVFSSRSGVGAHVYIFLDDVVTTRQAFTAGKRLARAAGITNRCDIIPSAEHYKGLGTLHALPLSPQTLGEGGGALFSSNLSPIRDPRTVVSMLRWADENRSPASVVVAMAEAPALAKVVPFQSEDGAQVPAQAPVELLARPEARTERDGNLLAAMKKSHPQFRRAIALPAEAWKGGRSNRDAHLAAYMRRQGMSPAGIVWALLEELPNTKSAERGEDYAWAIVDAQVAGEDGINVRLAGEPLKNREGRRQRADDPWAPWANRVSPPRSYGMHPSPWWRADVQERLEGGRSKVDGVVLAYLVDRFFRGPFPGRLYFAGRKEVARSLAMSPRTVSSVVNRLANRYQDVLRVVPGLPHPTLRLANGYAVVAHEHKGNSDQGMQPLREGRGRLVWGNASGVAPRDRVDQPLHVAGHGSAAGAV